MCCIMRMNLIGSCWGSNVLSNTRMNLIGSCWNSNMLRKTWMNLIGSCWSSNMLRNTTMKWISLVLGNQSNMLELLFTTTDVRDECLNVKVWEPLAWTIWYTNMKHKCNKLGKILWKILISWHQADYHLIIFIYWVLLNVIIRYYITSYFHTLLGPKYIHGSQLNMRVNKKTPQMSRLHGHSWQAMDNALQTERVLQ